MTDEMQREPEIKNGIEFYPGNANILLIAPHGHPEDDENTAELTQKIADRLKCRAITNRTYRKPKGPPGESKKKRLARNNGKPDANKKVLDLNSIVQAEDHPDFLSNIRKKVDYEGTTYVFWIHGIDDGNIENEAERFDEYIKQPDKLHALIGYGQGPDRSIEPNMRTEEEKTDSLTIEKERAEKFAQLLTASGMNTELTSNEATDYCGRSHDNMNQWFVQNKAKFPGVKSLQIEIRKKDFRDTKKNILAKANVIANAISEFVSPQASVITKQVQNKEDELTANNAFEKLKSIFVEHFQSAIIQAGNYLMKEFYADDYKKVFKNKPVKKGALYQLNLKINNNFENGPSAGWIYNAVKLSAHEKYFKENNFQTFGNLGHSQKLLLLNIKDFDKKESIAEVALAKKYSVRDLKDYIKKLMQSPDEYPYQALLTSHKNRIQNLHKDLENQLEPDSKLLKLYEQILNRIQEIEAMGNDGKNVLEKKNATEAGMDT